MEILYYLMINYNHYYFMDYNNNLYSGKIYNFILQVKILLSTLYTPEANKVDHSTN